jgi:hypothetical protein
VEGTSQNKDNDLLANGARIDAAMQKAIHKALWQHKQLGNPICAWRDGKVVWIAPEDIPVEKPPE